MNNGRVIVVNDEYQVCMVCYANLDFTLEVVGPHGWKADIDASSVSYRRWQPKELRAAMAKAIGMLEAHQEFMREVTVVAEEKIEQSREIAAITAEL